MSQLQRIPSQGNSIESLTAVSEMMHQYISSDNDSILEKTLARMNQEPTFWRKMLPNALDRAQNKIALAQLQSAYRDRRAFIDIYVQTQIEIARRRGDALVIATSLDLQTKLAAFATQKIGEFTSTIITAKEAFFAQSSAHWQKLEEYKNIPPIYERALQSCDKEVVAFLEIIETLRQNFTDALTAKVAAGKE